MASAQSRDFQGLIESLQAGEAPTASRLTLLSDLDRDAARELRAAWPHIAPDQRSTVLARATELAEDNVDLDFRHVALVALDDESPEVRRLGIEALWESEDRHVAHRLSRVLREDPEEGVRAAAAESLGTFVMLREFDAMNRAIADTVVDALRAAFEAESEPAIVRARAIESLGACSQPWVDTLIRDAYYSDDRELRLAGIHAMGQAADEKWLEYLFDQMESDDPEFRFRAVSSAGMIASEEAVPEVADLLEDADSEVVLGAINALAEIGGELAIERLVEFAPRAPAGIAEALADALAQARHEMQGFAAESPLG